MINSLFKSLQHESELPYKFFFAIARVEYALKASGYRFERRGALWPDWDDFANNCSDLDGVQDDNLHAALDYLYKYPPKKQIIRNDRLDFEETLANGRNNKETCKLVRAVRNNLFHGVKFPYDLARDNDLITSALMVLEALLNLSPDLQTYFH